jgi:hypothetical protein
MNIIKSRILSAFVLDFMSSVDSSLLQSKKYKTRILTILLLYFTSSFSVYAQFGNLDQKNNSAKRFASRSTTVSAEMETAKDNLPVKKETFTAKMERIKNDGNKVGVFYYLKSVQGEAKSSATSGPSMMQEASKSEFVLIEGEYADESLQSVGADFTAELNAALGRTDIDLLDMNKMPYRQTKFGPIDDFWATKYKVVFVLLVEPKIRASHEGSSGKKKFDATMTFVSSLSVLEYIGDGYSNKSDMITQMDMGTFTTNISRDEDIKDIKVLYEQLLEKIGSPLLEKLKAGRAPAIKKLVEKKLAP